jgi:CTP:molybdopterin cytidylyltransferase MocA
MVPKIKKFPLILLAGGRSSRMGTPKGLLDYQGHPWLLEQFRRFNAVSGRQVVIVLGFQHEQYVERIPWLEKAINQTLQQLGLLISVVINPTPDYGQFSSLQSAISFLQDNHPNLAELKTPNSELVRLGDPIFGAFILPVDVPCPGKEVF